MDIFLHIGAHRTATTSFQHYMRKTGPGLMRCGVDFWGPAQTRNGLFHGVIPVPSRRSAGQQLERARGRVALKLSAAEGRGFGGLVISDENLIGNIRANLRDMRLYPAIGERMARYHAAFGGRLRRVALSIRGQEEYWTSALSYSLMRVGRVPTRDELRHIAGAARGWRDVVTDLACALPGVEIVVMPHERLAGRPDTRLAALLGQADVPAAGRVDRMNVRPGMDELCAALEERGARLGVFAKAGTGTEPGARAGVFTPDQSAAMAEAYQDDLYWLRAGADGLARLCEETEPEKAGINPVQGHASGTTARGRRHGKDSARRLA